MKKKFISSMFSFGIIATSFSNYITIGLNAAELEERIEYVPDNTFKFWNPETGIEYKKGEIVVLGLEKKKVIQNFTANGDDNWWNAPSLFEEIPKSSTLEGLEIDLNTLQLGEPITKTLTNENGEVVTQTVELITKDVEQKGIYEQPEGFYTFNYTCTYPYSPTKTSFRSDIYKNQYGSTEIVGVYSPYNNAGNKLEWDSLDIIKKSGLFNDSNPAEARYTTQAFFISRTSMHTECGYQLYGGNLYTYGSYGIY
jgi:hypothetical protein